MKLSSFIRLPLIRRPDARIINISKILGAEVKWGNPYVENHISIVGNCNKSLVDQEREFKHIIRRHGKIIMKFGGSVDFFIECEFFKMIPDTTLLRIAEKSNLSVQYWFAPVMAAV